MKKYISIIAVTLITALILVACGGTTGPVASEESSTAASPTIEPLVFESGQDAAMVFGQLNFIDRGTSNSMINVVAGRGAPLIADGKLYLPDMARGRVMGYSNVPTQPGVAANFVVGRESLAVDHDSFGNPGAPTPFTLEEPTTVFTDGENLYVVDSGQHRIVRYDGFPDQNGAEATWVFGQQDLFSNDSACTATGLNSPLDATIAGGKLIVADTHNHRVLIWNEIPENPSVPADLVLGQPSIDSCDGLLQPTRNSLNKPIGVWSDGVKLLVVDSFNSRILVWDTFPTADNVEPDWVLGQPDFASRSRGAGAAELQGPSYVASNGVQIFVADEYNHRVLVWNKFPSADGVRADLVLGQMEFDRNRKNTGSLFIKQNGFESPAGLYLHEDTLIVGDVDNNRYLVFESQ